MSNLARPKKFRVSLKTSDPELGNRARDDGNPLSSLHFEPAWDSDELYDALRATYPQIGSHKDRLLRAVIEFYDAELGRARKLGAGLNTSPVNPPAVATDDGRPQIGKACVGSEDSELPRWQSATGLCASVEQTQQRKRTGIEGMQATFSIVPGGGKTRTKRPMTDAEREQYRQTKKVGACDPCRKRKRKCVCKLVGEAQAHIAKRARLNCDSLAVTQVSISSDRPTTTIAVKENAFAPKVHLSASEIPNSHTVDDEITEEAQEHVPVSRISRSLSVSPLTKAFYAEFDLSSFLLCPELNLGDLVMPGTPIFNLDLQDMTSYSELTSITDIFLPPESPIQLPFEDIDCEAFINLQDPAIISNSPAQYRGTVPLRHARPAKFPDENFTPLLDLISRARKALAPFSNYASDAQLLLSDLQTLELQFNLLRKSVTFLSKSLPFNDLTYDLIFDIKDPIQMLVSRLEQDATEGSHCRTLQLAVGVKDDARRLRGSIARKRLTISYLMALVSMETLRECNGLWSTTQALGQEWGTGMAVLNNLNVFH